VGGSLFTSYEQDLRRLATDLGVSDHVIFTGTKLYAELPRYIATMDVCTIPLSPPQWGDIALPNKFFEYSACGKPIVMRPIPDVARIGGPNLFVYTTREEFVTRVKTIMDNPETYHIDLEKYSWKEKAREFEEILMNLR
jgi:glycosyltransferase involved in cell wall biosynthesis